MELKETIELMCSDDHKERFIAEYDQVKLDTKSLKHFVTR